MLVGAFGPAYPLPVPHADPVSAEMLARVPLFARLDRAELDVLARHTRQLHLRGGLDHRSGGDAGAPCPGLLRNRVRYGARLGRTTTLRRQLQAGDYFGEIALLRDTPRTATVQAVTDLTCLGLSGSDFRSCLESMPPIAVKLLDELARRLGE